MLLGIDLVFNFSISWLGTLQKLSQIADRVQTWYASYLDISEHFFQVNFF